MEKFEWNQKNEKSNNLLGFWCRKDTYVERKKKDENHCQEYFLYVI